MKQIELPPIKETSEDFESIEEAIILLLRKEIYLPLMDILGVLDLSIKNSRGGLIDAILSGRIYFYRGHFYGQFNSTLSKSLRGLGARWDRTQGSWKVLLSSLPPEIKDAISLSEARFEQTARKIDRLLEKMLPEKIADKLKVEKFFDSTLWRVEGSIKKSIKGITVGPNLTLEQAARISTEYTKNLQLYVKDFTKKEITKLRETVQEQTFRGIRRESMVDAIESSFDVSRSKAKFLARQETSILMAKFKETRYKDAGITEYIWGVVAGSPKHPVRPGHKKLEGKKFRWDNPPIVDKQGNRKNPGEDYGCRCFARPVVTF